MMRNPLRTIFCLLAISGLVSAWAQEEQAPEPEAEPDQEVEISEENYRRHMELGDVELQRNTFPVTDYAAQAELQKMSRLPEASQRHLRDQLRDQIMQGGPWTPADAEREYPFVPSRAARGDGELRGKESEAWEELVGEYHAREAQMQANAPAGGGQGQAADAGDGQARMGVEEMSARTKAAAQQANAGRDGAAQSDQDSLQGDPQAADPMASGSEESALQFLTGGKATAAGQAANKREQAEAPAAGTEQNALQKLSADADASSTAAADSQAAQSQAAQSQSAQAQSPQEQSSQDQSAQKKDERPEVEFREEGVLAIRDLDKARGVVPAEDDDDATDDKDP